MLNYIDKNNITNNEIYFMIYFSYYVTSFYFKREKSQEIVDNVFLLCEKNNHFNNAYIKNKQFYDSQFKFIK